MRARASCVVWSTAVAAALWACDGNGDDGGTGPTTTGAVSGQVNLGTTGVGGIPVHLRASGATADAKPVQTTGTNGSYTFTAVAQGRYRVFIDVPDTMVAEPGPVEDTVDIVADDTATVTTFVLRLLVGSVDGAVLDTAGDPVAGRTVFLRKAGSTTDRTATTSTSGVYTFSNVVIGDYTVRVELACGEPDPGSVSLTVEDGMKTTATTVELTPRPSDILLSCDVQPIFTASCALSGCHGTSDTQPPDKPMVLTEGLAHENIVNVSSIQVPSMDRIEPFEPDSSYLVHKIQGTHLEVGGSGVRMPASGCCLSPREIDLIRQWVTEGALDN